MKTLIAYSSVTGNTKKLCEGVYNNLKEDLDITISTVKEMPSAEDFDTVIIGFWVDKGTANKEAKKVIKNIKNKKVILLGTLGAAPDSPHGQKVLKNVAELPDSSNEYLGAFICRGKVDEKLTNRIKFLPLPKKIKDQMYESSINSRETNEDDIANGTAFVKPLLA